MNILITNILVYIAFVGYISILQLSNATKRKIELLLGFLLLLSLYLFKNPLIFPDLDVYEDFFYVVKGEDGRFAHFAFDYLFEEGWVVLTYICKSLSDNFIWVIFSVSAFFTFTITQTIYRYSSIAWLSLILFICVKFEPTLYILRQAVAMGCFLMGLKYIESNKLLGYSIWLIIGYFFHKSIIVCFPLYFLTKLHINKKSIITIATLAIIGILVLNPVLEILTQQFYKIEGYNQGDQEISLLTWILPLVSLTYCYLCFRLNDVSINGINKVFFWMMVLEFILLTYNYIGTSFDAFYRLNFYFSLAKIFFISNATALIKSNILRNSAIVGLLICWIMYLSKTCPYGYEYISF